MGTYRYCKTCDNIEYYIVEETRRHKELAGCLGCWNRRKHVDEQKTAVRRIDIQEEEKTEGHQGNEDNWLKQLGKQKRK